MTPRDFNNFSVIVFTVFTYFGIYCATTDLITKKVFNFCVAFIFILEKFIRRRGKYYKLCAQFWVSFSLPKSTLCHSFYLKYKGVSQFFLTKACALKAHCSIFSVAFTRARILKTPCSLKTCPQSMYFSKCMFLIRVKTMDSKVTFRRQKTTEGFTLFIDIFLSFRNLYFFYS